MLSFLPIVYIFFIIFSLYSRPELNTEEYGVAPDKLKKAMQYHGIDFAEEKSKGYWIFKRDNKVCILYTESFEEYYKNKKGE